MSERITFQQKHELLMDELQQTVRTLCYHKGEESKDYSHKCVIPDDDFQFNIPNSGNWIVELTGDYLYDNNGHQYNYDVADMEILCQIVDNLVGKYV